MQKQFHFSVKRIPDLTSLDLRFFYQLTVRWDLGQFFIVQGNSTPAESQVIPPPAYEMPIWPLSITECPNSNLKKLTQWGAQAQTIEDANRSDSALSKHVILIETYRADTSC